MQKRRRYRVVLHLGAVCLLIAGIGGVWLRSERRQQALNRQLIAALMMGETQQALLLVNEGADPNTPLKPLPAPTFREMVSYLLHRSVQPTNGSPTVFMVVCGATFDEQDTGLSYSKLTREYPQLVQSMLKHGAKLKVMNAEELTPIQFAVGCDRTQTARILLENGDDVNEKPPGGWTLLMTACGVGSPQMVRLLLEHGAKTNTQNDRGTTALLVATIKYGALGDQKTRENIRQLLVHGTDPNVADKSGLTPLKLAQLHNLPDLVVLLKQAGAKK